MTMSAEKLEHEHEGILAPLTAQLARRVADERAGQVQARDPDFVRRMVPPTKRYVRYFSPEIRGIENLPASGPVLLVGNHSCLFYMPDTWAVSLAVTARRGADAPAYAMVHDVLFGFPVVGSVLRRLGGLPASDCEADRALAEGAVVLVYPGGDAEACRPWSERNRIEFGGRKGFVRLALRSGVPVVPVVTHGSHDAVVVLARGDRLARLLGLDRLRVKVFPIVLGPFGVTTLLAPPLPMPSAMTIEFMAPIDWSAHGPDSAEDKRVVEACYEEITTAMQLTLDCLHSEQPHPVLRGCFNLLRGLPSEAIPSS